MALSYAEPRFESQLYVPAGWPEEVYPPGAPDWERTATAFLLDCCPADYRGYRVLRGQPLVLAEFAAHYVEGELRASRDGLAVIRGNLDGLVDGAVVESAVAAWQEQIARLTRRRRAVALVEEALRGKVFIRRL